MKKFILDTLFPIHCLSCGTSDGWLCSSCRKKIPLLQHQVCPYCEKIETPYGKFCPQCKNKFLQKNTSPSLDSLIIAVKYGENEISRLIHAFKYSFISDLGLPLSKLIAQAILNSNLPLPDLIVPVPLHPRRKRWRGFNQAEILAETLAENLSPGLSVPIANEVIIRKKFTPPQMRIKNYSERKSNMENSFTLNDAQEMKNALKDKKILLIDDVATTGSTLFECGKVLRSAGAKKIHAAVIARQEIK